MARCHFTWLIGTDSSLSEVALQQVLDAQTQGIPEVAAEVLEPPIKLEELHKATTCLRKNKVPWRDGISVEFFLILWDYIGPILLEVLRGSLQLGKFHPNITKGIIVLLENGGTN